MSDDSDEGSTKRGGAPTGSGSSVPPTPSRQSSTANLKPGVEDASSVVHQFIKDVQPRHIKSKQKKHITAFARWYFSKKPALTERDLSYLLLGSGDKKGLLESCGNSNLKKIGDIKKSSMLALELVAMLLDATLNIHSDKFLEFLPKVPTKVFQSMKLERHILNETGEPDNAFKLLFMIQEQIPTVPITTYLDGSSEALRLYEDWYSDHMDEKDDEEAEAELGPRTWAQVKLEDCDREEMTLGLGDVELIEGIGSDSAGAAAGDEDEMMDPLGLTRINLNARGALVKKNKGGIFSSSKKMKLFWKSLLRQKEKNATLKKSGPGSMDSILNRSTPNTINEEDEEGEEELDTGAHLIDTIMEKGSINTSLPDFNPILFLNQIHSQTSLSQLEKGLVYLEQSLNDRTVQMKKLVEQYFGQYVYCKDTIDHLHQLLSSEISTSNKIASSSGRSMKLLRDIESVRQECEQLYAPLLQRKTETDQIRSVLDILQRFKFLFGLPKKLKEKKGWEQVIRDYTKAKQLVVIKAGITPSSSTSPAPSPTNAMTPSSNSSSNSTNTIIPTPQNSVSLLSMMSSSGSAAAAAAIQAGQLGIPESILFEIANLVRSLRKELFHLLDNPQSPWDEQEKVIEYLLALDCEEDPAWYYLQKQREAIGQLMEQAIEELANKIEQTLQGTPALKSFVPAAGAPTGPMRLLNGSIPFSQLVLYSLDTVSALNKFLRKLCHIFLKRLPDFFELATHIESGKFGGWVSPQLVNVESQPVISHRSSIYDTDKPIPSPMSPSTSNAPTVTLNSYPSTAEPHSVGKLISLINNQFIQYIRLTLFPSTPANSSKPFAPKPSPTAASSSASTNSNGTTAPTVETDSDSFVPFFTFPPGMFSHVHDILTCIESIKTLPNMPIDYLKDLRLLSDQLVSFYLEYYIRELLTNVANLHKEETWELDPIRMNRSSDEREYVLVGPDDDEDEAIDAFVPLSEATSPSNHGQPIGHGHVGTSATNSLIQLTLLPTQFNYLLRTALHAFSAIPLIQSQWLVERIVGAVFESMKVYADGLHALAIQIRQIQDTQGFNQTNGLIDQQQQQRVGNGFGPTMLSVVSSASTVSNWVKPNELDRRLLLIWSNLIYTADHLLLPIFDQLLHLLPLSTHTLLETKFQDDIMTLYQETLEQHIILQMYIKSKVAQLNVILRKGYFKNGMNWRRKTQSTEDHIPTSSKAGSNPPLLARSFVLEFLLQFVLIHDEIFTIRKEELDRIMELIIEKVAYTLFYTVKQIEYQCDVHGANQFLTELEFIESTLDYYLDDESTETFEQAKHILQQRLETEAEIAFKNEPSSRLRPPQLINQSATDRANLISEWKASTNLMFQCFTSIRRRKKDVNNSKSPPPTSSTSPPTTTNDKRGGK